MDKDTKLKVIELSQGKITQKKIAAEVGASLVEIRSFLKEFRENPAAITLELSKQEYVAPPEPEIRLPTMLETMQQPLKGGNGSPAIVMNPAVASLKPYRSSNSSKFSDAIFRPKNK